MTGDKLTIGRMIHYRTEGGICVPATTIRPIREREGHWFIQVNRGYSTDGLIVHNHNPIELLAWHWPAECPEHS